MLDSKSYFPNKELSVPYCHIPYVPEKYYYGYYIAFLPIDAPESYTLDLYL